MKIGEILTWTKEQLASAREAHYLLVEFLRKDLSYILSHKDEPLAGSPAELFRWVEERKKGRPLAYLSGRKEFFGQLFFVDERSLIPRPETEILVGEAIRWARERGRISIADVGTGSGCIAISLALSLPDATIWALDISEQSLAVARRNVEKYMLTERVIMKAGDLLSPLKDPVDMIVANLPYLSFALLEGLPDLMFEPPLALLGGTKGTELIERLLDQAKDKLKCGGVLLLEIGGEQIELKNLAQKIFPRCEVDILNDGADLPRLLRVFSPADLF